MHKSHIILGRGVKREQNTTNTLICLNEHLIGGQKLNRTSELTTKIRQSNAD